MDTGSISPAGYSSYNDTPGVKSWIEQTGIEINFVELVDTNAYLLYLAGGNLPDVIMTGNTMYPGGVNKMVQDGLAQDLTDLLPMYAPDHWRFINSDPGYVNCIKEPDGKFYTFAGYFRPKDCISRSWRGFVARKEYLDKLNMAPPETADDLYTFLKRAKTELNLEIPFMSQNDHFYSIFTGGGITSAFGLPNAGIYHVNGKVHYGAYEAQYKNVLAFMHKLYAERLLDSNFAVTDEPTANSAMLSGKSALMVAAASRIQNLTIAANFASDFTLLGLPAMSTAKGVKPLYNYIDGLVIYDQWCFLPPSSKNAEYALKALNYFFTEKGNILANFGQENLTFTYVNGQPVYTQMVTKNPEGIPLDGFLRANGLLNFPIIQDNRMTEQRFALPQQVAALKAWGYSDADKYRIANNNILAEHADEYGALITDINTYIEESRAQFISGALPLDRFDSYIANLKNIGMDRLLEILQVSYDVYNK
jgi:putative aldouronate transport system substrate-binding protein